MKQKYHLGFPFSPNIGVNATFEVESNSDDFFNRLHNYAEVKRNHELLKKVELQKEIKNPSNKLHRKLTPAESERVVERSVHLHTSNLFTTFYFFWFSLDYSFVRQKPTTSGKTSNKTLFRQSRGTVI